MQFLAKSLLLLSVVLGLTLSNALARPLEVPCDSPDSCTELVLDHSDSHPCDDCPPTPCCPDGHSDSEDSTHHHDDRDCPSPDHKHHHHHQCACTAASTSMITDSEPFSLHPPLPGDLGPALGFLFAPESTASVLERPPNA
ncbi:MAG: hypothetical protein OSA48_10370 [Akkermansiaceae bacterium]|nr:hypothetical protein [Akkermansiaceae bacterium]